MTTFETSDGSAHRLGRVIVAIALGLTLIVLPACSDDGHDEGDAHPPTDQEQVDNHMHDGDDANMHEESDEHEH